MESSSAPPNPRISSSALIGSIAVDGPVAGLALGEIVHTLPLADGGSAIFLDINGAGSTARCLSLG
jgi:hypothetical protein